MTTTRIAVCRPMRVAGRRSRTRARAAAVRLFPRCSTRRRACRSFVVVVVVVAVVVVVVSSSFACAFSRHHRRCSAPLTRLAAAAAAAKVCARSPPRPALSPRRPRSAARLSPLLSSDFTRARARLASPRLYLRRIAARAAAPLFLRVLRSQLSAGGRQRRWWRFFVENFDRALV